MPPGLSPKPVTSVSEAANAGRDAGTARAATATDMAVARRSFRLSLIA
jgi:hypothetical protein